MSDVVYHYKLKCFPFYILFATEKHFGISGQEAQICRSQIQQKGSNTAMAATPFSCPAMIRAKFH